MKKNFIIVVFLVLSVFLTFTAQGQAEVPVPDLPDDLLVETYRNAAEKNVLAAVNPNIFPGYWSVCADGQGFGYGNSYPSLDGLQLADALLWLGQIQTVKLNWDYVRTFLKPDGTLPLAIMPAQAGGMVFNTPVDPNGGYYTHWVPGNPLAALAAPTFIINTKILYEFTQDIDWLRAGIEAVNLSADQLASLTTEEGRVKGAGFYVERPTRFDSDGVAQSHAVNAFEQTAAMNRLLGRDADAEKYSALAVKIRNYFSKYFWQNDHFAEYYSPEKGFIFNHGLTDTDWGAIAYGLATPQQEDILWVQLRDEKDFYYGNMPTGIATKPESYEDWEFFHPDRHDLGAMGRVWFLMVQALYKKNDAAGILKSLYAVAKEGKKNDFYWRERYHPDGEGGCLPAGPNTYCEYPANYIRIVNRYLLGVDIKIDGSIILAPLAIESFWEKGFGQTLQLAGRTLEYRFDSTGMKGCYLGDKEQHVGVRLQHTGECRVLINDIPVEHEVIDNINYFTIPKNDDQTPICFRLEYIAPE